MKFFKEFKEFISRGNIMDMAIGVIIGGAFGKIVTSLVNDIIMPIIALAMGGKSMSDLSIVLNDEPRFLPDGTANPKALLWNYGNFIQTIIDFLIIALVIFIMIKVLMKIKNAADQAKEKAKAKEAEEEAAQAPAAEAAAEAAPAAPSDNEKIVNLLTDINESLKNLSTKE